MAVVVACIAVIAAATRVSSPTVSIFDIAPVVGNVRVVRTLPVVRTIRVARTVSVVGDSITVVAGPDIATDLAGTYRPDVHSIWGQRIDQMLPTLAATLRRHPLAVVVNLGSNDAIQAQTHRGWHHNFGRMIAMLASTRCVLLTTISTLLDAPAPAPPVAAEIDAAIARLASTHRNVHIVDWNAAVHATDGPTLLSPDQVHPSPAGQLRLAALIRTALDQGCRPTLF